MQEESAIFDTRVATEQTRQESQEVKLLSITANACIYRISKCGKHFLKKTTKDNTEQQAQMLQREFELSIGCDHPHIVHIYTIEEDATIGRGIVMEYIEGRTLDEYLAENPPMAERERIFDELLSAVGYLHKRGVIHNDLKPSNFLVTRTDNRLKLIDFGLADNDAHFALRTLGCTQRYASPELRNRNATLDARSDIYSVGVLMGEIFGKHHRRLAERCRHENPSRRYANIDALQRAWGHRNRPLKVVLGVVATAIFLLPLLMLTQIKLAERNEIEQREILFAQIERDVEQIYATTADSISRAVYYEFANNHITSFWDELTKYQSTVIATIADAELNTLATNVYTHTLNRFHKQLWEQAEKLPYIYTQKLSGAEQMFYNSLLAKRKPYRPYTEK